MEMTREQYANEIAKALGGEPRKLNKNGNEVWGVCLTSRMEGNVMPVFYTDDFYKENCPVDKVVEYVNEGLEKNPPPKFNLTEAKKLFEDYDLLKSKLYIRMLNEKALGSGIVGMSAEQFGFEDLVLALHRF